MNYIYENELVPYKAYICKWTLFLFAGVVIAAISYQNITKFGLQIGLYSFSAILILLAVLSFKDKTILRVYENEFIVVKYFLNKKLYKAYDIHKIDNLNYKKNVRSNLSFLNSEDIRFFGIAISPENMNNYYNHKEIISFKYGNKLIELGKWKK